MVTEIKAWSSEDGKLFQSQRAALEHDAVESLKKLGVFNHASATAIVAEIEKVTDALAPLIAYVESLPRADDLERIACPAQSESR